MPKTADEALQALLARAFARAPGPEANEAIGRIRASRPAPARSYELVLPDDAGAAWLAAVAAPKLAYHLDSLGARRGGSVFVSLFVREDLYFLEPDDVLRVAAEHLGTDVEGLLRRFGTGELHGPAAPAAKTPLALAPAAGKKPAAAAKTPLALPPAARKKP
jgi:hypothetical protein